jgi:peptidoglycan/LPS O-acetylase OafA/YrhL
MQTRNLQIDVLRGLAVTMVLATHTLYFRPSDSWDAAVVYGLWTGVDLFFVLSGFLISGLLFSEYQRNRCINFGRFAARRAMKIYPPFYLLITLALASRLANTRMEHPWETLVPFIHDVLFVQSYFWGSYWHFWSLSVEEHFYILLPVSLYIGIRVARNRLADPFRRLPVAFLILAVAELAVRVVTWRLIQPYDLHTHQFPTHLRLDSLMFGVLLSYLAHFHKERLNGFIDRNYWPLLVGSLALIAPALALRMANPFVYTVGFTFLYLGFGGLLMVLLRTAMPTSGGPKAVLSMIASIGKHSYSIYLWHLPLELKLITFDLLSKPYGLALYYGASLGVGIGLSMLVDIPVLKLRDRLWPRAGGPLMEPIASPDGALSTSLAILAAGQATE